jgi:hypothetical protein
MVPTAQPTARQLLKKQRVNCLTSEIPVKISNLVTSNLLVIYLTSSCVILAFFGMSGPVKTRVKREF